MRARVAPLFGLALAMIACRGGGDSTPGSSGMAESTPIGAVVSSAAHPAGETASSASAASAAGTPGRGNAGSVPLVAGLTLVSALRFPAGDRENVVRVEDVTPAGVTYAWTYHQKTQTGESVDFKAKRFVRANDLAAAPRYNGVFRGNEREETPGYTAMSLSRAAYNQVRARGEIRYAVTAIDGGPLGPTLGALAPVDLTTSRITLRGTLSVASPDPEPMSILLNGRRTTVSTVHLAGQFTFQDQREESDYWILADSANPLIMRIVIGDNVLQIVRIDFPDASAAALVEHTLERECRVELPGVYFAFASATLEPASQRALASLAAILQRHPGWSVDVEGHTDSIGDPAANLALSTRRADGVRSALVTRYGVSPARLRSVGFAATRPRESNATLEGRARNRRVELSRRCAGEPR